MKFSKIITNVDLDPKKIKDAEDKLTKVILDLSSSNMQMFGTKLGGCPFTFSLLYTMENVCSYFVKGINEDGSPIFSIDTAATDGRRIFWNPDFLNKLSIIGVRIVAMHEVFHSVYMHPTRIGSKNPRLWNIAIDYIVNHIIFEDLGKRVNNSVEIFEKNLGRYLTVKQVTEIIVSKKLSKDESPACFADPALPKELQSPERLYKYFYDLLKKNGYNVCDNNDELQGLPGECLDKHIPMEATEKEIINNMLYAAQVAKQMAGHVPSGLEDELGNLIKPKIRWQDSYKLRRSKGNTNNDWSRFKTRSMFYGLLDPKKVGHTFKFCCLLDTSGSMSKDDIIYGVSQLQVLDNKATGNLVCADAAIYWDKMTAIQKASKEELSKIKIVGRGGTLFSSFFSDYEKHAGECDALFVITDCWLIEEDVANMKNPGVPVYWLNTSGANFKPPFGKIFDLRN